MTNLLQFTKTLAIRTQVVGALTAARVTTCSGQMGHSLEDSVAASLEKAEDLPSYSIIKR